MPKISPISLLFALLITVFANADPIERQGFMAGGGLGVHFTDYTHNSVIPSTSYYGYNSIEEFQDTSTAAGLATDFMIGYFPVNSFAIFYQNSVAWYSIEDVDLYDALGLIGFRIYVKDETPGMVITAQTGFANNQDRTNGKSITGYGFGFGFGLEMVQHVSMELKYMQIATKDGSYNHDSKSLQFLINLLYY